ncbi:MAG: NAD-dependent succinate-semialdehyde dehydrogenase [Microbacteriaceae bacterium]|nr:NAD-dependent succinate-semialdehyde dehydrogenase [Microbacteriaceae bacterium]
MTAPAAIDRAAVVAGLEGLGRLTAPGVRGRVEADFAVDDPATGETLARVDDAPAELAESVVDVAARAQVAWEHRTPRERADVLRRAHELVLADEDRLAAVMTLEMGKPLAESRAEVRFSAEYLRWFSEEAVRDYGTYREAPNGGAKLLLTRRAAGVAVLITPWNFPLAMGTRKAAPALAAGCTVILKPAALTPLSALLLADLMHRAGVPEEALQVVTTTDSRGWSAGLMADPRVRKVSFTGSTRVGSTIIRQSAEHVQKLSLELGGDAPFVVLDDADLDRAVEGALVSKIRNGGQACVAANRILVQEGIADEFTAELARRLGELRLGHGLDEGVQLGPLISGSAREGACALLEDAVGRGAEVALAGGAVNGAGHFFAPAVLDDVPADSDIATNEIFAPIAAVRRFASDAEGVALANETRFGLAGYVFSQDIDRAMGVAHSLRTGVLGVNKGLVADATSEFGGNGYSGYGREGGVEGMTDFQVLRQFNIDAPASKWQLDV